MASGSRAHAVLTGDLVRSTRLTAEQLDEARATVGQAAQDIDDWRPGLVAAPAEFFRGDSWQLVLSEPRFFLRAAVYVRASLRRGNRNWDTRIGIGLGATDKIDRRRTSLSSGPAFVESGRELDAMGGLAGISVGIVGDHPALGWVNPISALCSAVIDHWSERQAATVCRMLHLGSPTQKDVASDLGVSKQTVSKSLGSADFSALQASLDWVESIDWNGWLGFSKLESAG